MLLTSTSIWRRGMGIREESGEEQQQETKNREAIGN